MVSVMPPSGVGGLAGPFSMPHMQPGYGLIDSYYSFRKTVEASSHYHRGRTSSRGKVMPAQPVVQAAANQAQMNPSAVKPQATKLAACGLPGCNGCVRPVKPQDSPPSVGDGGPPRVRSRAAPVLSNNFKSLFVDCSVEYELPMVPKIPTDSQPLLMIHPGWQQKRRVTRSSSQQRALAEQQQRMALQRQQQAYMMQHGSCVQCPQPQPQPQNMAVSRKRSYQQSSTTATAMPQMQCCYPVSSSTNTTSNTVNTMSNRAFPHPQVNTDFENESSSSKRARMSHGSDNSNTSNRSWMSNNPHPFHQSQCQERSCLEHHHRQMALLHQQQHHQYMLRNHSEQQQWEFYQRHGSCPIPLPAPPAPVSSTRLGPTGFFQMPGQYHWHPAYFCPPSAVHQQQQWLIHQQQQFNNNLPTCVNNLPCVKCAEGKCNMMFQPPMPMQARRTSTGSNASGIAVRYRSV